MKVYKGHVLTCDEKNSTAKYLVEKKGIIAFVGDELPAEYSKALETGEAEMVDLDEKALIPPFVDSHIHFASYATFHAGLNVMDAKSNQEILELLRQFAADAKEKLLIGFGASPYSVAEGRMVTRAELDEACPDKPLFMVKYDGHACVVNTALLEKVRKKVEHLRGYHEDTGEMNQEAFFAISDYVTNSIPIFQLLKNMQKAVDDLAERGIAMIHTVSGVGFTGDLDVDLERWFADGLDNGIKLRVYMQTLDVKKAKKRKMTRIGGCFDAALDGCFGSADAAMIEPYEGTDNCGVLYYDDETVIDFCKKTNREGMQIQLHAIGDRAFDQATRAIKAALDDYPRKDHRHGVIHACLPTEEGLEICKNYGIVLPVQSAFINWKQEPEAHMAQMLGEARSLKMNPLADFQKAGIVMSGGSDGPCTEPDPIDWIHKACNHSVPEQALTVEEALKMCTYNGYYTSFDEKKAGSLELGKSADMVILSGNPYTTPKEELNQLKVEQLLLRGKPYEKVKKGAVPQVLRGLSRSLRSVGCP